MPSRPHKVVDGKLTKAETAELDGYGELCGAQLLGIMPIAPRAAELWEREILFGSDAQHGQRGILTYAKPAT